MNQDYPSKMIRHPKIRKARYIFMLAQAVIWIVVFPLSIALVRDPIQIALYSAMGLAMLVYIPYALIISLRDRRLGQNRPFDHAGGEVAYLAISMITWFTSFVWMLLAFPLHFYPKMGVIELVFTLDIIQSLISCVWLGMIVWVVSRASGGGMNLKYRLSVNRLLRGDHVEGGMFGLLENNGSVELHHVRSGQH